MATAQSTPTIPTGTWQSDPVHSSARFAVKYLVGTFGRTFNDFEATLSDASGSPQLSGRAKVESVQMKDQNLYGALLSPQFFDAGQHPEIRFESNRISLEGDQVTIQGDLTVKGVTKSVVARGEIAGPASGPGGQDRLGIDLETVVNRHDYGLDWEMDLPGGGKALADLVTLTVHIQLVKESAGD
jgi:polyisoprenoid-binding protein YceI